MPSCRLGVPQDRSFRQQQFCPAAPGFFLLACQPVAQRRNQVIVGQLIVFWTDCGCGARCIGVTPLRIGGGNQPDFAIQNANQILELDGYRRWADPLLRKRFDEADQGSNEKLNMALAILPVDQSELDNLRDSLMLWKSPSRFAVVRDSLLPYKERVAEPLWIAALDPKREMQQRFQAACALATYAPDDKRWREINTLVANHLVTLEASALVAYREALRPIKAQLIEPLGKIYHDLNQEKLSRRFAT